MSDENPGGGLCSRLLHAAVRVWLLLDIGILACLFLWVGGESITLLLLFWNLLPIVAMLAYLQCRETTSPHLATMGLIAAGISGIGTYFLFEMLLSRPGVGTVIGLRVQPLFQWLFMLVVLLLHLRSLDGENRGPGGIPP